MTLPALAVSIASWAAQSAGAQELGGTCWWLDLMLAQGSVLVNPSEPGTLHEVADMDPHSRRVLAPDASHVLFIGSDDDRVRSGRGLDLFVARVDRTSPSGESGIRCVTTDQVRPESPRWLPDSRGVVFLASEPPQSAPQVWFASIDPPREPVRISDGSGACSQLLVLPSGSITYVQLRRQQGKLRHSDLILQPPGPNEERSVLVQDRFIGAYAIAPDGRSLLWGEAGVLHGIDIPTGAFRDIPTERIHPKLRHHMPNGIAFSPDGRFVAMTLSFAGGITVAGDDPDTPWPRMFADDKVFIIPTAWAPRAEDEKSVGAPGAPDRRRERAFGARAVEPERKIDRTSDTTAADRRRASDARSDRAVGAHEIASPFADEEDSRDPLTSPPRAGEELRPWWISGLLSRPVSIAWLDSEAARARTRVKPREP